MGPEIDCHWDQPTETVPVPAYLDDYNGPYPPGNGTPRYVTLPSGRVIPEFLVIQEAGSSETVGSYVYNGIESGLPTWRKLDVFSTMTIRFISRKWLVSHRKPTTRDFYYHTHECEYATEVNDPKPWTLKWFVASGGLYRHNFGSYDNFRSIGQAPTPKFSVG